MVRMKSFGSTSRDARCRVQSRLPIRSTGPFFEPGLFQTPPLSLLTIERAFAFARSTVVLALIKHNDSNRC
jgi:hypothetical protein